MLLAVLEEEELVVDGARIDASGEAPGGLSIRSGYEANTARQRPLDEKMQAGQIIGQEISGSVLGYCSQVNHSMCVGPPAPADWEGAFNQSADHQTYVTNMLTAEGVVAAEPAPAPAVAPVKRRSAMRQFTFTRVAEDDAPPAGQWGRFVTS